MAARGYISLTGKINLIVILLSIVISQFLRQTVILPVQIIGNVCTGVTGGDFEQKVTISNKDEMGILGETVN